MTGFRQYERIYGMKKAISEKMKLVMRWTRIDDQPACALSFSLEDYAQHDFANINRYRPIDL